MTEVQVEIVGSMIGKTMVLVDGCEVASERLTFADSTGTRYVFFHSHDCCETVQIEDVAGDAEDLLGSPIVTAEWVSGGDVEGRDMSNSESYLWTFLKFATVKGSVTVRWLGESNGYYSEGVAFSVLQAGEVAQ